MSRRTEHSGEAPIDNCIVQKITEIASSSPSFSSPTARPAAAPGHTAALGGTTTDAISAEASPPYFHTVTAAPVRDTLSAAIPRGASPSSRGAPAVDDEDNAGSHGVRLRIKDGGAGLSLHGPTSLFHLPVSEDMTTAGSHRVSHGPYESRNQLVSRARIERENERSTALPVCHNRHRHHCLAPPLSVCLRRRGGLVGTAKTDILCPQGTLPIPA